MPLLQRFSLIIGILLLLYNCVQLTNAFSVRSRLTKYPLSTSSNILKTSRKRRSNARPTLLHASPIVELGSFPEVSPLSLSSSGDSLINHNTSCNYISSANAESFIPPTEYGLSASTNTIIFVIGLIPFLWATYEFWSRIAVGASFGTGADSVQIRPSSPTIIGKDGDLKKSRGRRVLGDDALYVAYFLFAVAILTVGISVFSVITSPGVSEIMSDGSL